ncbi:mitogen-activated protein kinase kinase kinase 15 isoform X4 [Aethina tumida]|uniref:mitogen-activated protein kinase kinase kinase 15 isoform X4 n=1 Tax=Aethina tumida TaxID=116153 RepID=UPI0021499A02|nr:mitogen-activated protein kinase kinase kinase 15 isoform X4 [Aethina tumida]
MVPPNPIPTVVEPDAENRSVTDSVGSHSDVTAHTIHSNMSRQHMEVCCVIDISLLDKYLNNRKKALEEVRQACLLVGAKLNHIQFDKLDFGEANVVSTFYNADVVVIDMSLVAQQHTLFYHLGVRESFNMKQNILIYNDVDSEVTLRLKLSCCSYPFISYTLNDDQSCMTTNPSGRGEDPIEVFHQRLKKILQDVEIQSKEHIKEKFTSDLKKLVEQKKGPELREALRNIRKRLDDPNVLSGEVVLNMLFAYRDVQDYDSMIHLVEDLKTVPSSKKYINSYILHWYAFALNRRKEKGDCEKALEVCLNALEKQENHFPDMLCLCGRIYKDKFIESDHKDTVSLNQAIHWYRRGFDVQSNEYAGINLATLLVIAGEDFSKSEELRTIGMVLNNLIGKKGSLESLTDYWDIATFFEISVLGQHYAKAIQAAERMFKLKPPDWYLKSTIGNIQLIEKFRRKKDAEVTPEEQIFDIYMEFFLEATKPKEDNDTRFRFPVLIMEPSKEFITSYVCVNLDAEPKNLRITNICKKSLQGQCTQIHDWEFSANNIRSVSFYKRDERCLLLYVHHNSDDFQIYFPSMICRSRFYDLIRELTNQPEGLTEPEPPKEIRYEYEKDENGKKIILGKGTYGIVYAARDLDKQIRIAVKEIPEKDLGAVQPFHEEIQLHSFLRHKNIVQYLGSISEENYFKIFMEQVPGGSLSALLRSKWGPLKKNEHTIAHYTKQILEGLRYLHEQKIVHRDIKGDNVLVNTYNGVLKISDFGTSKRLAGLSPNTETFAGTLQYMAPEVIDKGQRGYGAPADIWSLGCTVVEMATGKPPFIELGSPQAAVFKVGMYKQPPQVPEELSDRAKSFIKRCFEPDPDKRATASELLEDPFLGVDRKKSIRLNPELSRSVSVPYEKVATRTITGRSSAPNQTPTTPDSDSQTRGNALPPIQMPTSNTYNSLINTPSLDLDESQDLPERRNSQGALMSPEADAASETDGFYHLKKDSQRRQTLTKVLSNDGAKICEVWMKKVREKSVGETVITAQHLQKLMDGLRAYLTDSRLCVVENTVKLLKEELEFDGGAINQLQFAIYQFQESVNEVLRRQQIKPHWMFALDNLIRSCVMAAIEVLSPELGQNLANHSSPSTVNSEKSVKSNESFDCRDQMLLSRAELVKLEQEYTDLIKRYSEMMRRQLEIYPENRDTHLSTSRDSEDPVVSEDPRLGSWLQGLGIHERERKLILSEGYTLEEVLFQIDRDDLRRIRLKGASELRIWRAILQHRQNNVLCNGDADAPVGTV